MHGKGTAPVLAGRLKSARCLLFTSSALVGLAALSPSTGYAQSFQPLGVVPGGDSEARGISADGLVVVGCSGSACGSPSQAIRWKADGSSAGLGFLSGYPDSFANAVSAGGSVVVGASTSNVAGQAFRWTAVGGMTALGFLPGNTQSQALSVSADGSVVVGYSSQNGGVSPQAFRWTAAGMVGLGFLPGNNSSSATGVSADGSVVVGNSFVGSSNQAFRWTTSGGMAALAPAAGYSIGYASGVSADGSAVVGVSYVASLSQNQASRWTAATGTVGLGYLSGGTASFANAANADGSVVVGASNVNGGAQYQAMRWTAALGLQPVQGILTAGGFDTSGWQLNIANGVSADGTVIVGTGPDPNGRTNGWIARIPVNAFALLDLAGVDHTLGSLIWGGTVTNSATGSPATLRVGSDNSSTTFIGVIQDGASKTSLLKEGTGTQTLSGNSTYSGTTTINGGALNVTGSIASSSLTTVNSGGTLTGTGTVGNTTIANGGTFVPGNGTPGSFMTVAGNLAFQSGALYLVGLNPATATFARVTGAATLNGAAGAAFASGNYVAKQYTILTAAGGINGAFSAFDTLGIPSGFKSSLSYDANHAYLNLALNFVPNPTPNFGNGLDVNQQNVANALVNFFNRSGGIPMVFGTLSPAGLTQISGELPTASQQTTFDAMNLFMGLLTDPFVAGRGDPVSAGGGASPFAAEDREALAYAANGKPRTKSERDAYAAIYRKAPIAPSFEQRWSVWAAGYGGSQTTDGNTVLGSNNTRSSIGGVAVGADYRFSPNTLAGFAVAGGGTNFSVNGLGSGRSDLFQAGAFIRHNVGPAYISAALAYGWQDITTDRTVTVAGTDLLRANFNANAYSGRLEGGYRFVTPWLGGIGLTPYAAGQFTTFDLPAYAEQAIAGANTFALSYMAKNVTDTRSELGVRTDKSFAMQNGIFTLRGRAAWAHDFNPDRNIGATFQTLPGASFVVNGAAHAADSALVTASAEMKWLNGFSLAGTFEGEFSNVTASYAGKGVVRYAW